MESMRKPAVYTSHLMVRLLRSSSGPTSVDAMIYIDSPTSWMLEKRYYCLNVVFACPDICWAQRAANFRCGRQALVLLLHIAVFPGPDWSVVSGKMQPASTS